MPYIGRAATNAGSVNYLDDISSGFNGSETDFTCAINSTTITPGQENVYLYLDGVFQHPTDAYTISGSTITFTEAPASGVAFTGYVAGEGAYLDDGTVSTAKLDDDAVTASKLDDDGTGFQVGDLGVGGSLTSGDKLTVTGRLRASDGILTSLTTGAITQSSGTLTIKNSSGDSNGLKIFQDTSDASKIYNHYNGTLQLGTGNTTRLEITSDGRVIQKNTTLANSCFDIVNGSSSGYGLYVKAGNSTNYALSVNSYDAYNIIDARLNSVDFPRAGTFRIGYGNSADYGLTIQQDVTSGLVKYSFDVRNNGTDYDNNLVLDRGNVSIGQTSPDAKLHIKGDAKIVNIESTSATGRCYIMFEDPSANKGFIGYGSSQTDVLSIYNYKNNGLSFGAGNAEVMSIDTSGNLTITGSSTTNGNLLGGGQRFATSGKSVSVGSSTTFDISGSSSGFVFVKILIKVGWNGNATYQMHAMYDYVTSNYGTSGGTATQSNIRLIGAGNAQFNYTDISISRPSDRTVRLTYAPTSGSGTHTCSIYVSGVFDSLS